MELFEAISGCDVALALELLEKPDTNYNFVTSVRDTSLIYAIYMSRDSKMEEVALKLLDKDDINYNHIDNDSDTALVCACEYDVELTALKLLDKPDINYNHKDIYGHTAFIWVCQNKMESVALKLLERKDLNEDGVFNEDKEWYESIKCNAVPKNIDIQI
jgi:ankyrin repeat protein